MIRVDLPIDAMTDDASHRQVIVDMEIVDDPSLGHESAGTCGGNRSNSTDGRSGCNIGGEETYYDDPLFASLNPSDEKIHKWFWVFKLIGHEFDKGEFSKDAPSLRKVGSRLRGEPRDGRYPFRVPRSASAGSRCQAALKVYFAKYLGREPQLYRYVGNGKEVCGLTEEGVDLWKRTCRYLSWLMSRTQKA
ncbi:MAG TPA: hypothetical protein VG826_33050 [Pirellulales bacterium]|nr:hypothetical protein [Pirellulales bacterium]